ncbi:hypothetical protein M758_UG270100 [Ceratodon purpureus]|nr:hypothetical protein M758_UG270100 [Ceratodon purpureus]
MMSGERGRLLANVRQRYSFSPDYGGELGVGQSLASHVPSDPALLRRMAENLLWLTAAVFAIYYGDSRHHLFHVLLYDPRIRWFPFQLGLLCLATNAVIFAYLAVYLRHILKAEDKWELIAPAAVPTATLVGLTSSLLFSIALWPIWGFLTLPLLFTLFMAFVVISPYLPPYGQGDSLRSE